MTLPTKLQYDITKTVPGGAIQHDYLLAHNINLKKRKIQLDISLNAKCKTYKTLLQINTSAGFTLDVRPTGMMKVYKFGR